MATVPKDSVANLTKGSVSIRDQVEASIGRVERAYSSGLAKLSGNGLFDWQSDFEKNAQSAIKGLRGAIDAWATKGRTAAASGKTYVEVYPKTNGWPGWTKAAGEFVDGINKQVDTGDSGTFNAIVETAKEAPATTAKAVVHATNVAMQTAGSAVSLGILRPVGIALGVYVLFKLVVR